MLSATTDEEDAEIRFENYLCCDLEPDNGSSTIEYYSNRRVDPKLYRNRHPCLPGTRVTLINKIIAWLTESPRQSDLLWLYGGIGTGKTAVMETLRDRAEELQFHVVPVFVLASRNPPPTSLVQEIAEALSVNGLEDENDLQTLFKLLVESIVTLERPEQYLIILDGLSARHLPLVKLICTSAQLSRRVLWSITTRPLPEMGPILDMFVGGYLALEMPTATDAEVKRDVELYLAEKLKNFVSNHLDFSREARTWPSQEDVAKAALASSHHFSYAKGLLKIIHRRLSMKPQVGHPSAEYVLGMRFLDNSATPSSSDVYKPEDVVDRYPLDGAYRGLVNDASQNRTTLAFIIVVVALSSSLTSSELSILLHLPSKSIEEIIWSVRSVIVALPTDTRGGRKPLHLGQPDFPSFFFNPQRSGSLMDKHVTYSYLVSACLSTLQWKSRIQELNESRFFALRSEGSLELETALPRITSLHYASLFVVTHVWDLIQELSDLDYSWLSESIATALQRLRHANGPIPVLAFHKFLYWLHCRNAYFVRTEAMSTIDQALIGACEKVAQPLDFSLHRVTSATDTREPFNDKVPRYVLFGTSQNPVLIVLVVEGVTIYSYTDIADL